MIDEADAGPLSIEYALVNSSKAKTEDELYYKLLSKIETPGASAVAFADAVKYIMRRLGPPKA